MSILERAESLAKLVAGRGTEKVSDKEICNAVLWAKNIATDTCEALTKRKIDATTAAAINDCNGRVILWVQLVLKKRQGTQLTSERKRDPASMVKHRQTYSGMP